MSLRTWKTKRELKAPVFSWCPFIQHAWQRKGTLSGLQENGLGQVRTFVLHQFRVCYGPWENTYRQHMLQVSLQDRFLEMNNRHNRWRTRSGQVLTVVRGGQA